MIGVNRKSRISSRTKFIWFAFRDAFITARPAHVTVHIRDLEQVANRLRIHPASMNVGFPAPPTDSTDLVDSILSLSFHLHVFMCHFTTLRHSRSVLLLLLGLIHCCRARHLDSPNRPDEGDRHPRDILLRRGPSVPGLVTSPRLFCPAPLPKNWYGIQDPYPNLEAQQALSALGIMFPPSWSYLNFSSLVDLCSREGRPGANFGGEVRSARLTLFRSFISILVSS